MAPLASVPLGSDACRALFLLDFADGAVFANHGSYGAVPAAILERQQQLQRIMESHPDRWFRERINPCLAAALAPLAAAVNSPPANLVFVTNASAAMHCMFGAANLQAGDTVFTLDVIYPSTRVALQHAAATRGARVVEWPLPLPIASCAAVLAAIASGLDRYPKTTLLVVDHVSWSTGVVLPVAEIVELCRTRGIISAIDGAHAVGAIDLDLAAMRPDFYCSNFHKWGFAPKGAAFLYADPRFHALTYPPVIAKDSELPEWQKRFAQQGTRDATAALTAAAAWQWYQRLGMDRVRAYNHELVTWAVDYLAERFGTQGIAPAELCGCIAVVRLPLPAPEATSSIHTPINGNHPDSVKLMTRWLAEENCIVACFAYKGTTLDLAPLVGFFGGSPLPFTSSGSRVHCPGFVHARLSAQVYNRREDYVRVGDLVAAALAATGSASA